MSGAETPFPKWTKVLAPIMLDQDPSWADPHLKIIWLFPEQGKGPRTEITGKGKTDVSWDWEGPVEAQVGSAGHISGKSS